MHLKRLQRKEGLTTEPGNNIQSKADTKNLFTLLKHSKKDSQSIPPLQSNGKTFFRYHRESRHIKQPIPSHEKLIYKLHNYGVKGKTLSWIKSFLDNRTRTVVTEGKQSRTAPVTSGIPQGSVLEPILFLAYINDLPDNITSQVRLFADDTVLYQKLC